MAHWLILPGKTHTHFECVIFFLCREKNEECRQVVARTLLHAIGFAKWEEVFWVVLLITYEMSLEHFQGFEGHKSLPDDSSPQKMKSCIRK